MRLTTWNVNSVRLRTGHLPTLIEATGADVLCLQETKVIDEAFPRDAFAALGYRHQLIAGQKNHNGVAILSRLPFDKGASRVWCERQDCRHASISLENGIELHNFYVPAGGDEPDPEINPKFRHKLDFVAEMNGVPAVSGDVSASILVGDLNIAPMEHDVWSHKQLLNVVSHTPAETESFEAMRKAGGWVDLMRLNVPDDQKLYTWWSYRAQDWAASDRGRRLDHMWCSPAMAGQVTAHRVLEPCRGWERPSDHVPLLLELSV